MAGVLQGVRVVEFTHMVAGPACGQVLGDFGAEVIKVEPPQGDITRRMGPMAGDVAALYASTNRNKQVVCLDLTNSADAAEARQLALGADVVISNLDAALLKKAGLDAPALRRANPLLICVEVTGFGPGGPAGTDGLAQAAMGLMATTGSVEGPSFRTGPSVVDVSTGVWAALGVFRGARKPAPHRAGRIHPGVAGRYLPLSAVSPPHDVRGGAGCRASQRQSLGGRVYAAVRGRRRQAAGHGSASAALAGLVRGSGRAGACPRSGLCQQFAALRGAEPHRDPVKSADAPAHARGVGGAAACRQAALRAGARLCRSD